MISSRWLGYLYLGMRKMQIRESVRSGRRENFYVTDNGFIDHYAREMQPTDVAVYHALERFANCHTRSTWVGTAKIAEVLNVSQRTVQRSLKVLEELKLIRVVQTATVRVYYIVPVPPRAKATVTPLFDSIEESKLNPEGDSDVAWAPAATRQTTRMSHSASRGSSVATIESAVGDSSDIAYKEEQDYVNKTKEQELSNKSLESNIPEVVLGARKVLKALRLSDTSMASAIAAVEDMQRRTTFSMPVIVSDIVMAAQNAGRRNVTGQEHLDEYLARKCALQILQDLAVPVTNNLVSVATAAVKAEVAYAGLTIENAAARIRDLAANDRQKGTRIDRFYFENATWRAHGRIGKGQQQFDRIKRARDEAHAIIDSKMDH
jgi:DNA-binding MarR family transcriptional regulator